MLSGQLSEVCHRPFFRATDRMIVQCLSQNEGSNKDEKFLQW